MKKFELMFGIILVHLLSLYGLSADWAEFRGPDGNPVHDGQLPLSWDVEGNRNVGWKASLPEGTAKGV